MNCTRIFAIVSLCITLPTVASQQEATQKKTQVVLPAQLAIERTRIQHPWDKPLTGPEYCNAEDELERAIVNDDFKHAIYFCNQGANVNWPYTSGNALHMLYRCVTRDFAPFAILLLWAKADPNAKDAQGKTPQDLLKQVAPKQAPYFQVLPTAVLQVKKSIQDALCITTESANSDHHALEEPFQLVEYINEQFHEEYVPLVNAQAIRLIKAHQRKPKK